MSEIDSNVVFVHGPEYAQYWVNELDGEQGNWKIEGNVVAHHDFITVKSDSLEHAAQLIQKVYAPSPCPERQTLPQEKARLASLAGTRLSETP